MRQRNWRDSPQTKRSDISGRPRPSFESPSSCRSRPVTRRTCFLSAIEDSRASAPPPRAFPPQNWSPAFAALLLTPKPIMPLVVVSPLSAVPECIRLHAPSLLVTLLSPEYMIETPAGVNRERHLRLSIDDIVETLAGASPPTERHVLHLLEFSRSWDAKAPI